MHANKQKELVNKLNELDAAKVRFYDAKQRLLKEGYSEDEIAIAVAGASFDGKVNQPKKPDGLQQVYKDHPEDADLIAKQLLLEDAEKRQRETRLHALGTASWGAHVSPMSARGLVSLADTLGVPLFKLAFVAVIIVAVLCGVMQLTHLVDVNGILVFLWVYAIMLSSLIGYKLMMMEVRTARLRASVNGKSDKWAIVRGVASAVLLLLAVALTIVFAYVIL